MRASELPVPVSFPQEQFTAEQLVRAARELGHDVRLREYGGAEFAEEPARVVSVSMRVQPDEGEPLRHSLNKAFMVSDGPMVAAETARRCVREFFSAMAAPEGETVLDQVERHLYGPERMIAHGL